MYSPLRKTVLCCLGGHKRTVTFTDEIRLAIKGYSRLSSVPSVSVSGLWHSNLPISAVVIDSDDSDNEIKTTEPIIKTRRLCRMQEIAYQELLWKDKAKDMYQYVLSLIVSHPPFGLCICHPKKPMNLEADSQQPVTDYDNYLI
jgi:hypothetical protein